MNKLLFIFIGGGLGSVLRYAISLFFLKSQRFACFGTFTTNIIGCLLIGYVYGLVMAKTQLFSENIKAAITIGFLGGLTTFSTFSLETLVFLKDGKLWISLGYILLSIITGLFCVWLGYVFANRI